MTISILGILHWAITIGTFVLVLCGLAGAVMAALTRDDAFEAADRQNKWIWVSILALSSLVLHLNFPFLSWIGIVIIGLYWFDVRPQIKDILSGNYGWH